MSDVRKTERTRIKRLHENGTYDRDILNAIVDSSIVCHVGYVIDGSPYVTPTTHWRDGNMLYWHGSSASKMMRALKVGIEVCVTISHLDGLVLARSGFNHSINYRTAMMFGTASIVDEEVEKLAQLKKMMDIIIPGRWEDCRPPSDQEMKATMVLGMPIDEAAAKVSAGPPEDETEDYNLSHWAGVIPIKTVVGEPIDDPVLAPGIARPDYLDKFILNSSD